MLLVLPTFIVGQTMKPKWIDKSKLIIENKLVENYGDIQKDRIDQGLYQVSAFWNNEDGDQKTFEDFVLSNFAGTQQALDEMFNRFEYLLEMLDGHMLEISRNFKIQTELDLGKVFPFDEVLAGYNPAAHVNDDLFQNKIAFTILLNFPLKTLEEKIKEGSSWSRRQWAEVRLAERFSKRIPSIVLQNYSKAAAESDQYIADYNIFMYNLLNEKGDRLFPKGMRLLSHWNLRDEIKSNYNNQTNSLEKQKMIVKVMERIVDQSIPKHVINNPNYDWNPFTNQISVAKDIDSNFSVNNQVKELNKSEPNTRYKIWLNCFLAAKQVDPFSPTAPTHIKRRFNEDRELPEERVKKMFEAVLTSPLAPEIAKLIESRLNRKLEPFDIWYNGFKPKSTYTSTELDEIVKKKYPTPLAFKKDIPNVLVKLGFAPTRAEIIANNIMVDPARGSGHAMGSAMRTAKVYLRTRVAKDGMDYKGFNIAIHELGHNVEQTISINDIDHTLLQGVPNTAFTEAIAFVFQAQDLNLLGLSSPDEKSEALKTLNDFWMTYEIAGVSLVDMEVWHWLYDNPKATPEQLKSAVIKIAKDVWNKYYTPVFGYKDVTILAIYSHMIHSFLYLPDYTIGHLISHQIEEQIKKTGRIGEEVERICRQGRISPDLWMMHATGSEVGPEALLKATEEALKKLK
jgi:hypothetical protein